MYSFRVNEQNHWFLIHDDTGFEVPWNKGKKALNMWIFDEWNAYSKIQRKAIRRDWIMKNVPIATQAYVCTKYTQGNLHSQLFNLDTLKQVSTQEETKKDNPMYANACAVSAPVVNIPNPEDDQRAYLRDRLYTEYRTKWWELRRKYGIDKGDQPEDRFQMVEWVKKGWYTLKETDSDNDDDDYYGFSYGITWGDPAIKKDTEGFKLAEEKLDKARQSTKDLIVISTPASGLKALNDFVSQTFN